MKVLKTGDTIVEAKNIIIYQVWVQNKNTTLYLDADGRMSCCLPKNRRFVVGYAAIVVVGEMQGISYDSSNANSKWKPNR